MPSRSPPWSGAIFPPRAKREGGASAGTSVALGTCCRGGSADGTSGGGGSMSPNKASCSGLTAIANAGLHTHTNTYDPEEVPQAQEWQTFGLIVRVELDIAHAPHVRRLIPQRRTLERSHHSPHGRREPVQAPRRVGPHADPQDTEHLAGKGMAFLVEEAPENAGQRHAASHGNDNPGAMRNVRHLRACLCNRLLTFHTERNFGIALCL